MKMYIVEALKVYELDDVKKCEAKFENLFSIEAEGTVVYTIKSVEKIGFLMFFKKTGFE